MGAVFHRLFQHDARTGVLVFQFFVYCFQFFYIRMLFQLGRHAVELFAVFDLLNLRFTFLVDLYIHFYAVYLFGGQVGKKFFNQFGFHAPGQAGNVSVTGVACQVLQSDVYRFLFAFLSLSTEFLALFQELLQVLITIQQFFIRLPSQWDEAVAHQ